MALGTPACILCDGLGGAHDVACPSLIPAESLPDALSAAELDLLARRADVFLADDSMRHLEKHLTRAATMALLGLTRRALLPGGKDPAMTSLRATRELIQMGEEWFKTLVDHKAPAGVSDKRAIAGQVDAQPTPERKSRRRRV